MKDQEEDQQLHVIMEAESLGDCRNNNSDAPVDRTASDSFHQQQQPQSDCFSASCYNKPSNDQQQQKSLLQLWQQHLLPLPRHLSDSKNYVNDSYGSTSTRDSNPMIDNAVIETTSSLPLTLNVNEIPARVATEKTSTASLDSKSIIAWQDICIGDLIASGSFASVYKISLNTSSSHHHRYNTGIPTISSHRSMIQVTNNIHSVSNSARTRAQDELLFNLFDSALQDANDTNDDFEMEDCINNDTPRLVSFSSSSRHSYTHSMNNSPSLNAQKPYVLKRLNAVVLNAPDKLHHGIKGIKFEAQLLSETNHPNIVRMYGISSNFMSDPSNGFLVLEYLVETLDHRLLRWMSRRSMMMEKKTSNRRKQTGRSYNDGNFHLLASCQRFLHLNDSPYGEKRKNTTELKEQLTRTKYIAYGIANALAYLHHHHVLYRDLKPSNVGFDGNGTVKIFDFDLSRRYYPISNSIDTCHHQNDSDDEQEHRKLTSCIGSLRYMSPECAQGMTYSFSSDVHSFGILLWEICCVQRPYSHITTTSTLVKNTFIGNERPPLRNMIMSPIIKKLLQKCWNPDPMIRPTMFDVVDVLRSLQQNHASSNKERGSPTLRKLITRRKNG